MKGKWLEQEFGELADFQNGLNFSRSSSGPAIKVLGVAEFGDRFRVRSDSLPLIHMDTVIGPERLLQEGDIVLVRSNGNRALIGRALFIQGINERFGHSGFTIRARVTSKGLLPEFAARFLQSSVARLQFQRLGGGTNISNLSQAILGSIAMPIPPTEEQARICSMLNASDNLIDGLIRLRDEALARKRGLMQQLLTGKKRFKEFKGERWKPIRMGELLQEVDRYAQFDDSHTYRLASIRRRSEGLFFREELKGSEIKTKVMKTIKAGDFLISKMQVVHGAWGLVPADFDGMFVSDSYICLVAQDAKVLSVEFFNYLSQMRFMYHKAYLACHGVHIEKMTFKLKDFLEEKITIPPTVGEQLRIAEVLKTCDQEIGVLEDELAALKEQKRGLMQKLLTGEVRVKAEGRVQSAERKRRKGTKAESSSDKAKGDGSNDRKRPKTGDRRL